MDQLCGHAWFPLDDLGNGIGSNATLRWSLQRLQEFHQLGVVTPRLRGWWPISQAESLGHPQQHFGMRVLCVLFELGVAKPVLS